MSQEEKNMAIISHAGTLLGYVLVIGNFIVPMVVWLLKHEESDVISDHSKASLNFQLTMLVLVFVAWLISWIPLIGWLAMVVVTLFNVVCVIIAAIKANDGELFDYPLSYPFLK